MLTKKQEKKLDTMTKKYCIGVRKTFKLPEHLIDAFGRRYRIAMEQELLRQGKH